jgi:hypothetical protein
MLAQFPRKTILLPPYICYSLLVTPAKLGPVQLDKDAIGSTVSEKTTLSGNLVNRGSSAPALLLSDVGCIGLPEVADPRTLMRKTI